MKITSDCNYEKWQHVRSEVGRHYRLESVRQSET